MASLQKKKHYQVSLIREEVKRYVDIIKRVVEVSNLLNNQPASKHIIAVVESNCTYTDYLKVFITPWKEKKRDNNPMLTPKIAESIFANLEV